MPGGDESYVITQPAPLAAELTQGQPHDNEFDVVFGSGFAASGYVAVAQPTEATVLAMDPASTQTLGDVSFANQPAQQEPAIGGSAQTLGHQAPQPTASQVQKMDPNVGNLGPGLALAYGINDTGVTSTIVVAPQTAGPQGSAAVNDPGTEVAPVIKLTAGNQSDITTDQPHGAAVGTEASGAVKLPTLVEDPNEGGGVGFALTPNATNETFTTDQPHAPQTGGPSGGASKVDVQEGGAVGQDVKPPVQYGQSAP